MNKDMLPEKFVFGLLSAGERADAVRARLCDADLDREVENLEMAYSSLAGMAGSIDPPAALKNRVMDAVSRSRDGEAKRIFYHPFASGRWRKLFPGVEIRRIWQGGPKLLRCAPASVIPAHDHDEDEYLTVLVGDFLVDGYRFGLGDHLFSPQGTRHGEGTTQDGCVLLLHYG